MSRKLREVQKDLARRRAELLAQIHGWEIFGREDDARPGPQRKPLADLHE